MRFVFYFIFSIIFFAGCTKDEPLFKTDNNQKVFFQREYINYAWAHHHNGWYIDSSGYLHTYNSPAEWNFPDAEGNIPVEKITENLNKCEKASYKLDSAELVKYISYINSTADAKITEPRAMGADMGMLGLYCFVYNAKDKVYKRILLKEYGDLESENTSMQAKQITEWLLKIKIPASN